MNLQLFEPAIAPHISGTRQRCASRSVRLVISLFAVCLFATAAFALDPQKSITQLAHTVWAEKDGAPADIVAITQTGDGYLWLGTWTGLFSFDGVRFTHFEPQGGEHLPDQTIRRLLATRDGSLWIVFHSGTVSRLLHGHLTSYSKGEGFPATFALAECKDGSLIAGTAKGLARFKNGVWTDVTKVFNFPGKQARVVYVDRENTLWVVTEDRIVYTFPPDRNSSLIRAIWSIRSMARGNRAILRKHLMERFGFRNSGDLPIPCGAFVFTVR
jgi:ligand-binding sensor domain-containing protein